MAHRAILGSVLMNCRIRRPSYNYGYPNIIAIMAGNTIAGDASVRKRRYRGGEKISSRVAEVTILSGWQMAA